MYFVLPHFYGKTLHKLVAFTQHAGLARNIKDQLPRSNTGLIDAYREIIPALLKQSKEEGYYIKKNLPQFDRAY